MKMKFSYTEEFLKDFKKLKKKVHSLENDLDNFKKFIPAVDFNNNKRFITLVPYSKQGARIIKTRLMVRSLKGSSMTRVIFAFCVREDLIEFIEIYLKNEKPREDESRIKKYLKI